MITEIEGTLDGSDLHVGIVAAQWNQSITERLVAGARERCVSLNVARMTVAWVPGALEIPVAALAMARSGADAIIAIGAVVKGETDHYEIVVRESAAGLSAVSLQTGVPVGNAILAVHDVAQAMTRSGEGAANKGWEAADAAVTTANLVRIIQKPSGV